jgi:hypothetical protein
MTVSSESRFLTPTSPSRQTSSVRQRPPTEERITARA